MDSRKPFFILPQQFLYYAVLQLQSIFALSCPLSKLAVVLFLPKAWGTEVMQEPRNHYERVAKANNKITLFRNSCKDFFL